MIRFGLCALLIILGGCTSPQQIEAAQDAKCRSFGAKPGTQGYLQCRMQLQAERHQTSIAVANSFKPPTWCSSQGSGGSIQTVCW